MRYLIVGGSSGLGMELARQLADSEAGTVIITGRHDPEASGLEFRYLDLSVKDLSTAIENFVSKLPKVDALVYAAGYYQEGRVTDLSDDQIEEMLNVGGRGLIYLVRALLKKQDGLKSLATITSTSQWIPRKLEPIYNFVKAGAGHLSDSFAEDGRIDKVLVVGPAGMKTDFWREIEHPELDTMNDPADVARLTLENLNDDYRYRYIRILRDPLRLEVIETRK